MATRIMVIDDELLIGQLLLYQLSGAGYEVLVFQSGAEALARLAYDPPDLVLLDVMMPEVSGWDLCLQIRSCSAVPVIMLTAKDSDDDVVTGLNCGADDYIGKPFSAPQLIARIEAVLRRSRGAAKDLRRPQPGAGRLPAGNGQPGRAGAAAVSRLSAAAGNASGAPHSTLGRALGGPSRGAAGAGAAGEPAARTLTQRAAERGAAAPAGGTPGATRGAHGPRAEAGSAPRPEAPPPVAPLLQPSLPRLGPTMAEARRQRRMSLHDAERACGVRWEFLQAIEQEQFGYMPRPQLRVALRAYSDLLGIDLQPYMGRRRSGPRRSLPASLALSAVIVLLIVLTLVVIVL